MVSRPAPDVRFFLLPVEPQIDSFARRELVVSIERAIRNQSPLNERLIDDLWPGELSIEGRCIELPHRHNSFIVWLELCRKADVVPVNEVVVARRYSASRDNDIAARIADEFLWFCG